MQIEAGPEPAEIADALGALPALRETIEEEAPAHVSVGSAAASDDQEEQQLSDRVALQHDDHVMPEANSLIVYEEVTESVLEESSNLQAARDANRESSSSPELIVADEREVFEADRVSNDDQERFID